MLQYTDTWWVKLVKRGPLGELYGYEHVGCQAPTIRDAIDTIEFSLNITVRTMLSDGYMIEEVKHAVQEKVN